MEVKIDSITLGFALYIACEYHAALEYREKHGGDVEDLKSKSTRELIAWLTPQGVIEEMQEHTSETLMSLIDFYMEPDAPWDHDDDMKVAINEVENHVERLVNLIDEGKVWGIVATNMAAWSERDVGDDEPGVLVDPEFLLTLVKRGMHIEQIQAHLAVWSHGPMQVIVGCSNPKDITG